MFNNTVYIKNEVKSNLQVKSAIVKKIICLIILRCKVGWHYSVKQWHQNAKFRIAQFKLAHNQQITQTNTIETIRQAITIKTIKNTGKYRRATV